MFFSSTFCSIAQPMFYKEALPSDKGLIYIPTTRISHCNLDFILCKHMTHMHGSLFWNLGWEPTLSYLWYECQRWLEETKSKWFPTFILTSNFHFLYDLNFLLLLVVMNIEKATEKSIRSRKSKNHMIIERLSVYHFHSFSQPGF